MAGDDFAAWSARMYGAGWVETRRRYWASRWRRKRCYWCRRGNPGVGRRWVAPGRLQLNHLTYSRSDETGACPLWVLRPMCPWCHEVETRLVRWWRPRLSRRHQRWAHAYVTVVGRLVVDVVVWALVVWLVSRVVWVG